MIKIKRIGKFEEMLTEIGEEDPEMINLVRDRIKLFMKNPDDTRLENHALTRRMEGKSAFSITSDIRIVYEWLGKTTVRFLAVGRHKKVYS